MRSDSVLAAVIAARLEQAPAELLRWFGRDGLQANLRRHLAGDVQRLTSDELAESFAYHCAVPGAVGDDYKTKWLPLPGFGQALVGIRFRSLDMSRPFVAVVASETLPVGQDELGRALGVLRHEFQPFAPKHVRVFLPPKSRLRPSRPGQFWEKRVLAGKISELLDRPLPRGCGRVTLVAPTDDGWYERYQAAFQQLVDAQPEYREYTRSETRDDLTGLLDGGTLFEVMVDGEWAGLTAVERDGVEGVEGYLMIEVLLAAHARGQGFGTALHRRLIELLPDPDLVMLGTIDARNLPAVGAAERLGRVDVGGYLWAPFPPGALD